jgi:uncharacterized protein with HEPN domain
MNKTNEVYLRDMVAALNKIEQYTANVDQEEFAANTMQQDAVIRQLQVIGEAAAQLSHTFKKNHPTLPADYARIMRNFLIHNYDEIDLGMIWRTVQNNLPSLKRQLEGILAREY